MPNDLDTLMSRIDEINAKSATELTPSDIDIIIAYHRNQRSRRASSEKFVKPKSVGLDISAITNKLVKEAKPVVKIDRRI